MSLGLRKLAALLGAGLHDLGGGVIVIGDRPEDKVAVVSDEAIRAGMIRGGTHVEQYDIAPNPDRLPLVRPGRGTTDSDLKRLDAAKAKRLRKRIKRMQEAARNGGS
jgi:hypothetical protein